MVFPGLSQNAGSNKAIKDKIYELIKQYGPISNKELKKRTGKSKTAVNKWVNSLIAEKRVIQEGKASQTTFRINPAWVAEADRTPVQIKEQLKAQSTQAQQQLDGLQEQNKALQLELESVEKPISTLSVSNLPTAG